MDTITPPHQTTNHGVTITQLKIANALAFILTIAINGISSSGAISKYSVGEISDRYPTKITPAGGAFAIWGIIYMIETYFIIYQFFWPKQDEHILLHEVGFWFISSCVFNSLWIVTFVQGYDNTTRLATILIGLLLFSLCKIYLNTNCWNSKRNRNILQILAIDVHFTMYASWVTVATIASIAISLTTIFDPSSTTETVCTIIMVIIAFLLSSYIVCTRRDIIWGWVFFWASFFIASANKDDDGIYFTALIVSILSGVLSIVIAVMKYRDAGNTE